MSFEKPRCLLPNQRIMNSITMTGMRPDHHEDFNVGAIEGARQTDHVLGIDGRVLAALNQQERGRPDVHMEDRRSLLVNISFSLAAIVIFKWDAVTELARAHLRRAELIHHCLHPAAVSL